MQLTAPSLDHLITDTFIYKRNWSGYVSASSYKIKMDIGANVVLAGVVQTL